MVAFLKELGVFAKIALVLVVLYIGYFGVALLRDALKNPQGESAALYGFVGGILLLVDAALAVFSYTTLF